MKEKLKFYMFEIDKALEKYVKNLKTANEKIFEAVEYCLFSGGKRVRPALMLNFFESQGSKNFLDIMNFACALEMIHTYSLIHDDLPCMDDDDLRRGKPTCHVKFGEATAVLAGDMLLTCAFDIINSSEILEKFDAKKVFAVYKVLSRAANDMVLGQDMDIKTNEKKPDLQKILEIYKLKTGALLSAPFEIAAILSGKSDGEIKTARELGETFGICFQLADDIDDGETHLEKEVLKKSVKEFEKRAYKKLELFKGDKSFVKFIIEKVMSNIE